MMNYLLIFLLPVLTFSPVNGQNPVKPVFSSEYVPAISMVDFQNWLKAVQENPSHEYNGFVAGEGTVTAFELSVKHSDQGLYRSETDGPYFTPRMLEVLKKSRVGTRIWLDNILVTQPDEKKRIISASFKIVE